MNRIWVILIALMAIAPIAHADELPAQDAVATAPVQTAQQPAQPQETPAPYERPASIPMEEFVAPEPGSPFTVEGDAGIAVDGRWYPILRDFSELKSALGEPLDVVLTDSLIHPDYYDKEFIYEFGSVYTHPMDGIDVWYEIFVDGDEFVTSRGIGIGSTPDEVLAAYGDVYYAESATINVYSLSGTEQDYATPSVTIEAINNGVIYIDVYYPVYDQ